MAGIVQQQRECRNGATGNMLAKKTWPGGGSRPRLLPEGRNSRDSQVRDVRLGAGPPRRTARRNSVITQIVRAAENRTDEAGALRDPPRAPHPRVPAVHHFLACEIE